MSNPTSQFITPSPCPCVHISVLYICVSIPALQVGSSVPSIIRHFYLPCSFRGASTVHAARLTTGSESIYVGCANERRRKKRKWVIPCDVTRNLTSDVYTHWGHIDTIPEWHTLSPPAYSATPHVWLRWPLSGLWNSHFPWFSCCTFFSVSFPPFRPSSSGYSLKKNFF